MSKNCPTCNDKLYTDCGDECDNSCGTKYCDNGHECYLVNGSYCAGHDPNCGIVSDYSESESDLD